MVIPIFPLSLIVFPQSSYPLHIFEDRYKKLINNCLQHNTGFGIVAEVNHEISEVGVYVEITEVLKKFSNGEMDIIVKGKYRFKRLDIRLHLDGYYIGEIEEFSDITKRFDMNLLEELKNTFHGLLDKINYDLEDSFWNKFDLTPQKSFKVAEKSGLTVEQQVEILSLKEENKRLKFLLNHFTQLEKALTMKAIVLGDGYLN